MQEALVNGVELTVQKYIKNYGNPKAEGDCGDRSDLPTPFCPECDKNMIIRAKRGKRDAHFAHVRNSGPCPTKAAAAAPYKTLKPSKPDPVNAQKIRLFVRDNWPKVFRAMEEHLPKLSTKEFLALLKRATRNNVWAYQNLEPREIPSLLCVLADFPDGNGRRYWLRFWFTAATRRPERLWINPELRGTLQRGSYFHPKGVKRPTKIHICRVKPIDIPEAFLTAKCRRPPGHAVVDSWFKRQKAFW